MADLKTNYVDDKLDTSKNQLRKYNMITNDDGTVSFVDVTNYTTVGTNFGAKDINDTNSAINQLNTDLSALNESLNNNFVTDAYKNKILTLQNNINLLSGDLTMNETRIVSLETAINSPIVTNGTALHKMIYTDSPYFTNIVTLFILDTRETWYNYYQNATGRWLGWVKS